MKKTEAIATFVVDHARVLAALLLVATLFFLYPIVNSGSSALGQALPGPVVRVDANARDLFPSHPFIHAQDKFEGRFGNASPVALAMVVEEGSVFSKEALAKLKRITDEQ